MIQSYDVHHFRAQNGQFVLNKIFLVQANVITFIYLLVLFIVQNLKKFLQWTQNYDCAPFFGTKWSIPLKQFFFSKIIVWNNFRYHLPSSTFHFAKFKKKNSSSGSRVMRICNFWTRKVLFPQMTIFS